ncbi:hypothetical protein G6F22_013311 [Rhizopus arrhizus]|nr:hypothetical protein G6F22_013311 [Rhizopus arrhizus]
MVKRLTNELSAAKSSSIWLDDVIQLLQLCDDLKDEERHVLQAIVELISSLYDCNMKTPSESHLASSYVHPFIHGLFSSKHPSKIAHCSNLMVDEQTSTNTRRPDYKTDVYESYEFAYTTNLGKLKPTKTYHLQTKLLIFIELL